MLASRLLRRGRPLGARGYKPINPPSAAALETWRRSTVVCFDVDSTVCAEEGIDVLAEHCGAGEAVREWTTRAMDGGVPFEEALAARLQLIRPSAADVRACLRERPPQLVPGIESLVDALHGSGREVFLVSGGFRAMIEPVANALGVLGRNVVANSLLFDAAGEYAGFDADEPTARSGGKAAALAAIRAARAEPQVIVMVGDGVTDLEARPPADLFIGFGGVVRRPQVEVMADWFVGSFKDLEEGL